MVLFLLKIAVKVKTPGGGADDNRNDPSTGAHATQDVSTVVLYSRVCVMSP